MRLLQRKASEEQHGSIHQLRVGAAQQPVERVDRLAFALEVGAPEFTHRIREPLPRLSTYLDETPGPGVVRRRLRTGEPHQSVDGLAVNREARELAHRAPC